MQSLEVVAMIYKSVEYLDFIQAQLDRFVKSDFTKASSRIVGNDPTPKVQPRISSIYHDPAPEDYYLNRVYRCWNHCVKSSKAELVVLVNSDMAFSDGWIDPLVEAHYSKMLPVSRLVESGKLVPGMYCIEEDFGKSPSEFNQNAWLNFAKANLIRETADSGMFMPVLFDREEFLRSGGYPHGNVGSISGDAYFFEAFQSLTGRKHVTCFDSLVYHIQEGEKDS